MCGPDEAIIAPAPNKTRTIKTGGRVGSRGRAEKEIKKDEEGIAAAEATRETEEKRRRLEEEDDEDDHEEIDTRTGKDTLTKNRETLEATRVTFAECLMGLEGRAAEPVPRAAIGSQATFEDVSGRFGRTQPRGSNLKTWPPCHTTSTNGEPSSSRLMPRS